MRVEVKGMPSLAIDSEWLTEWRVYSSWTAINYLVEYKDLCAQLALELYQWDLHIECEFHSVEVEVMGKPSLAIDSEWLTDWRACFSWTAINYLVEYQDLCA